VEVEVEGKADQQSKWQSRWRRTDVEVEVKADRRWK
jgi:hypothetical protein